MKLTKKQKYALSVLNEEKSLSKDGCKIHNNVMNALYSKGLVKLPRYANGEFWEITDNGLDVLSYCFNTFMKEKRGYKRKLLSTRYDSWLNRTEYE